MRKRHQKHQQEDGSPEGGGSRERGRGSKSGRNSELKANRKPKLRKDLSFPTAKDKELWGLVAKEFRGAAKP